MLYEMLTGKKAFDGETATDILAAVVMKDPDWLGLPASTPRRIRELLERSLAKDRRERLQAIGEARIAIERASQGDAETDAAKAGVRTQRPRRESLAWTIAGLSLVAAAFLAWQALRPRRAPAPGGVLQASLDLPAGFQLARGNISLALSPDGKTLLVLGTGADGKNRLWVKPMDGGALQPLNGSENATYPFWSPDGRKIGFFADGKLKETEVGSGMAETIANAPQPRGGSWGPNGTIVFAPSNLAGLYEVPATGGAPVQLTKVKNPQLDSDRLPYFLPDGRHLLFSTTMLNPGGAEFGIFLLDLKTREVEPLLKEASNAVYAPPGYLLYYHQGYLMAQPFDLARLRTTGSAVALAQHVKYNKYRIAAQFSVSETGLLVYMTG